MSFRMRRGRTSFNIGSKGPRVSYRLGCALTIAFVVLVALTSGAFGRNQRARGRGDTNP